MDSDTHIFWAVHRTGTMSGITATAAYVSSALLGRDESAAVGVDIHRATSLPCSACISMKNFAASTYGIKMVNDYNMATPDFNIATVSFAITPRRCISMAGIITCIASTATCSSITILALAPPGVAISTCIIAISSAVRPVTFSCPCMAPGYDAAPRWIPAHLSPLPRRALLACRG